MSLIKDLWNRVQAEYDEVVKARQLKNLRLQAENELNLRSRAIDTCKTKLEKIVIEQKDKDEPSFKDISDAYENVKIAEEKFQMSKELYKEFFGKEPEFS